MKTIFFKVLLSINLLLLSLNVNGQCTLSVSSSNTTCSSNSDGSIKVLTGGSSCNYSAPYGTENANTVLNSSKSNYNLVGIEKVVVTSGFSGSITVNSLHGKLIIDEAVTLQSLDFKYGEVLITKNGSLTVPNINIGKRNNWAKIKNYGVLNVTGASSKVKSFIQNYGVINVSGDLLLGKGSNLSNYCTVKIANKLKVTGGFGFYNYGGLIKTGSTILNENYQSRLYNESILETGNLKLKPGASIQGFSYNATLKVTNSLVVSLGAMINGNLELCVEGNEKNSGTITAVRACNNSFSTGSSFACSQYDLFKLEFGGIKTPVLSNSTGEFNGLGAGFYVVEANCDDCPNAVTRNIEIKKEEGDELVVETSDASCSGSSDGTIKVVGNSSGASCGNIAPSGVENATVLLDGSSNSYNLSGAEKVVVQSGFSGSIVVNNLNGKLVIDEAVTLSNLDFKIGEVLITENGSLTLPNISIGQVNEWAKIKNYGTLNVTGPTSTVKSFIENYGLLNVNGDLILGAGSNLSNYCTVKIANKLKVTGGFGFYNYSGLIETGSTILNKNYQSRLYNESILETGNLKLKPGASIQGFSFDATLKVNSHVNVSLGAMITGNLEFCLQGTEQNDGVINVIRACDNTLSFAGINNNATCSAFELFEVETGGVKTLVSTNTTGDFSGLKAGVYIVKANCSGCKNSTSSFIEINEGAAVDFYVSATNTNPGECDAKAEIIIKGAVQPADIKWNTGGVVNKIANLCPGDYHVTVTSQSGCSQLEHFSIEEGDVEYTCDLNISLEENCLGEHTIVAVSEASTNGGNSGEFNCSFTSGYDESMTATELSGSTSAVPYFGAGQVGIVKSGQSFNGNTMLMGGKLVVFGTIDFTGVTIQYGEIVIAEGGVANFPSFSITQHMTTITNYGELNIASSSNFLAGKLYNYGTLHSAGLMNLSHTGTIENNCMFSSEGDLNLSGGTFKNLGVATVKNTLVQSFSSMDLKNNSSFSTENLTLHATTVTNSTGEQSNLNLTGDLFLSSGGTINGNIKLCQPTGAISGGQISSSVEKSCDSDDGNDFIDECVFTLFRITNAGIVKLIDEVASNSTGIFGGLAAGEYVVKSICGDCISARKTLIIERSPLKIEVFHTPNGTAFCGGKAFVSTTGGSGNHSYSWSNGETRKCLSAGVDPGIYTATVIDNVTGCSKNASIIVNGGDGSVFGCDLQVNNLSRYCGSKSKTYIVRKGASCQEPIQPAISCGAWERETTSNSALTVAAGEIVGIPSNMVFTNEITVEGHLIICGNVVPQKLTINGGKITVLPNGTLDYGYQLIIPQAAEIENFGEMKVNNFVAAGEINNHGTFMAFNESQVLGTITNSNSISLGAKLFLKGSLENNGFLSSSSSIEISGPVTNSCNLLAEGNIILDGDLSNSGIVRSYQGLTLNGSANTLAENSVLKGSLVGILGSTIGASESSYIEADHMFKVLGNGSLTGNVNVTARLYKDIQEGSISSSVTIYNTGSLFPIDRFNISGAEDLATEENIVSGLPTGLYFLKQQGNCGTEKYFEIPTALSCDGFYRVFRETCVKNDGKVAISLPNANQYTFSWRKEGDKEVYSVSQNLEHASAGVYKLELNNDGVISNYTIVVPGSNCGEPTCNLDGKLIVLQNSVIKNGILVAKYTGGSNLRYTWYKEDGTYISASNVPLKGKLAPGNYYVKVEDLDVENCYEISDVVTIVEDEDGEVIREQCENFDASIIKLTQPTCKRSYGELYFDVVGGSGQFDITWKYNGKEENKYEGLFGYSHLSAGDYSITIEDNINQCNPIKLDQNINSYSAYYIEIEADKSMICNDENGVTLSAVTNSSSTVKWFDRYNNEFATGSSIEVTEASMVYAKVEEDGCSATSNKFRVRVQESSLDFKGRDFAVCEENPFDYVSFGVLSSGTPSWYKNEVEIAELSGLSNAKFKFGGDYKVLVNYDECGDLEYTFSVVAEEDCLPPSFVCKPGDPEVFTIESQCRRALDLKALKEAKQDYDDYVSNVKIEFEREYKKACRESLTETFTTTENEFETFQYTLFYYDQSGNLVRTVSPGGVNPIADTDVDDILEERDGVNTSPVNITTAHDKHNTYAYNSLGSVMASKFHDHTEIVGTGGMSTQTWFDWLGRTILSQDAEQAADNRYSYRVFDDLGREIESGEVEKSSLSGLTVRDGNFIDYNAYLTWLEDAPCYDVSFTFWDVVRYRGYNFRQRNLRSKISSIAHKKRRIDYHDYVTYFTYDALGNVDAVLKENTELHKFRQGYKLIEYEYDLVSGKTNKVIYQKGQPDQFAHKYEYDDDNRLLTVHTSRDLVFWDEDVSYEYYDHGPIARKEFGNEKVQGLDFAYTIQGWIKGVNSGTAKSSDDIGSDGLGTTGINSKLAKDEFGYIIDYFDGDFESLGTTSFSNHSSETSNYKDQFKDLYNGNIAGMASAVRYFMAGTSNEDADLGDPLKMAYKYDQLHRLTKAWMVDEADETNNNYSVDVTYLADGEINSLKRRAYKADGNTNLMDQMAYNYVGNTNKLDYVNETATGLEGATALNGDAIEFGDIKSGQLTRNYSYDEVGNLIGDISENIANITWTPRGKVQNVTRVAASIAGKSPGNDLEYEYDADGRRMKQLLKPRSADGSLTDESQWVTTYYVYGPKGQLIAVYDHRFEKNISNEYEGVFNNKYHTINGYSKIATREVAESDGLLFKYSFDQSQTNGEFDNEIPSDIVGIKLDAPNGSTKGNKLYELVNHIGNVLAVISDRKIAKQNLNGDVVGYTTEVKAAKQYYPFGMVMPGYNYGEYDYGFNGKMTDEHFLGLNNSYDFGARMYDPRLGKFLSLDPLKTSLSGTSPYSYAFNSPIAYLDHNGELPILVPIVVGALIGAGVEIFTNDNLTVGSMLLAAGKGAIGGAAAFALAPVIGATVGTATVTQTLGTGIITSFTVGGGMSLAEEGIRTAVDENHEFDGDKVGWDAVLSGMTGGLFKVGGDKLSPILGKVGAKIKVKPPNWKTEKMLPKGAKNRANINRRRTDANKRRKNGANEKYKNDLEQTQETIENALNNNDLVKSPLTVTEDITKKVAENSINKLENYMKESVQLIKDAMQFVEDYNKKLKKELAIIHELENKAREEKDGKPVLLIIIGTSTQKE